jgi:hypothetical protein
VLFERFVQHIERAGASVHLRMHDRHRYEPAVIERMAQLARAHAGLELKPKDEHPDSLIDLHEADVLVSNYSSLLNFFYFTGEPTIHIDAADSALPSLHRSLRRGRLTVREVARDQLWKLEPIENRGLRATSFDELLAHVTRALREPSYCVQRARDFVERYVTQVDERVAIKASRAAAAGSWR